MRVLGPGKECRLDELRVRRMPEVLLDGLRREAPADELVTSLVASFGPIVGGLVEQKSGAAACSRRGFDASDGGRIY